MTNNEVPYEDPFEEVDDTNLTFKEFCAYDDFNKMLIDESFYGDDSILNFIWSNLWYFMLGTMIVSYHFKFIESDTFGKLFEILLIYVPFYCIFYKQIHFCFKFTHFIYHAILLKLKIIKKYKLKSSET
jgi:hypothetical protein